MKITEAQFQAFHDEVQDCLFILDDDPIIESYDLRACLLKIGVETEGFEKTIKEFEE